MKKLICMSGLCFAILACNNSGDDSENGDTTGVNLPAVENVNGNIPDTTNTIPLDNQDTSFRSDTSTP